MLSFFQRSLLVFVAFTLAPLAAAAQGYQVSPGDVLRVEVLQDPELNRSILVAPDGRITFPLAGTLSVSGRSLSDIQNELTAQLEPNFASAPNVLVSLERVAPPSPADPVFPTAPTEAPTVTIFALGEVGNKGRIDLEPGTRLLQAFAQLGGFSDFAATKRIQLRRYEPSAGREVIYSLNYNAIMSGRSQNGSVIMQEGDVILVPTRRLFE